MLKVLMVAPTPFFSDRGCHIRIYEEARSLIGLGVKVRIVSYFAGRDLVGVELRRGGAWVRYQKLEAGPSWRKLFADGSLAWLVRREVKEFKPDLLHCHLHEGAFLGWLGGGHKLKMVLDYQGSLSSELSEHQIFFQHFPISALTKALEGWINARVDRILLNCAELSSELGSKAKAKAVLVGDGVDLKRFSPQARDLELMDRLGLNPEIPVVVYLGLLNRYQGVEVLLRSAQILYEKKLKVQFLIMGYPLGEYPAKAERMGLKEMVRFSGRVDYFQAEKFLALGEVAVAPKIARSEGNGKILNYLAMGLPVVCFDRRVNRELAGDCAEYVKFDAEDFEGNAKNLALAIEALIKDPARRRELGKRGRERAEREFSWEKVALRILDAYQGVLA